MATSCTGSAGCSSVRHRVLMRILNAGGLLLAAVVAIAVLSILVGLVAVLAVQSLVSLLELL